MYKHDIKDDAGYYAEAQALPQNTSADGNGGVKQLSGTQGGIEVKAVVNTAFELSDAKVLTIALHDSAGGTSFTSKANLCSITASGTESVAANTVLGVYTLPSDTERYTKVVLTTTDADVGGKVDVYATYNPR